MLILRLQHPDDQEFAYTTVGDTALFNDWTYGAWPEVTRLAGNQAVILLIPTREVLLTQTMLITTNPRQLRQALPYALEESLVGELEEQHFVWQAHGDSGALDVAVIDYNRLGEWMRLLRQHKLKARAILPDVFALPWDETQPTIWQRQGLVWVRTGALSGFSCPAEAASVLIDSIYQDTEGEPTARAFSDSPAPWQRDLRITPEPFPNRLTRSSLDTAMGLNLLQGYQDKSVSAFNQHWKRWRAVAAIGILTVLIAASLQGMEIYHQARQVAQAEQRNVALFQEVFPSLGKVPAQDIRSRTRSELRKMELEGPSSSTRNSPLPYLSVIGRSFQKDSRLKITEIRVRNGRITLVFEAPELQALDRLQQDLAQTLGQEIDIKSTETSNMVRAELTLEMTS